jgi:hypothetical protein
MLQPERDIAWRILLAFVLLPYGTAPAQAAKRCDLALRGTPGAEAGGACLDLVSLSNGGPAVRTAGNATRISREGFRFCKDAFRIQAPAAADVVFIFDNSLSMFAKFAFVDPARGDTLYYFGTEGCADRATNGNVILATATNRQVSCPALRSNAGCRSYSGDPYEVRGKVIRSAIDYMTANSPLSTAGVTGFARTTMHALPSVALNVAANVSRARDSAIVDSSSYTNYGPPLALANRWLADTTLRKTAKPAIVFISDGTPSDSMTYLQSVNASTPIFSIFLGQVSTPDTANLKRLSDLTQGAFARVSPNDTAAIQRLMQDIIKGLLISTLPQAIEVTNASLAPPQTSRSQGLVRNPDSSIGIGLDSIIGLVAGANEITVKIRMNDTAIRDYSFRLQADGPIAAASDSSLTCFDPPALTLVDPQGRVPAEYPAGNTPYLAKLTRATSDLGSVQIVASTADSAHGQAAGDRETLSLNLVPGGAPAVYQGPSPVASGSAAATSGDGILQAANEGTVTLGWAHPRDAREFATYTLTGRKIHRIPAILEIVRVTDVARGTGFPRAVPDPIVLFGGAALIPGGPGVNGITHGECLANCAGDLPVAGDPSKNPSFVFKTASPFGYEVSVFDNLGHFVNASKGAVDENKWLAQPRQGDSVAVAMSFLPVARNGCRIGSGVYILRVTLNSHASKFRNEQGDIVSVMPGTRMILNRFGYLREP